jgi:hypothetical protein
MKMNDRINRNDRELRAAIAEIVRRQADGEFQAASSLAAQEVEFEKWRLIHKYVHRNGFATRDYLKRSEQCRDAAERVRNIGEPELLDFALQQVEIAGNLERGIRDMRPRKNGPCHPLVLEYVANRKRKALAVLHFAKAGQKHGVYGVNSAFHSKTVDILRQLFPDEEDPTVGHEDLPWFPRGQ